MALYRTPGRCRSGSPHGAAVPTGCWAGASAELRLSVWNSRFTRQEARESGLSLRSPCGQQISWGPWGHRVSRNHRCLPHTRNPVFHPEGRENLAVSEGGSSSPSLQGQGNAGASVSSQPAPAPVRHHSPGTHSSSAQPLQPGRRAAGGTGDVLLGPGSDWQMWGQWDQQWAAGGTQGRSSDPIAFCGPTAQGC